MTQIKIIGAAGVQTHPSARSKAGRKTRDVVIDLDPTVQFDRRHPFPGSQIARERLWRNYRIGRDLEGQWRMDSALYIREVFAGWRVQLHHDQFQTNEARASLRPAGSTREHEIFSENVSVSIRVWLPLRPDVPEPDDLGRLFSRLTPEDAAKIVEKFQIRAESLWFPSLPGISARDITENYAEYLGFRAVERWAKVNLKHPER